MLSSLDFGCNKTVQHGFSETGFYLKFKIIFSCWQTSNSVRKYLKSHSYSYYLHGIALCAAVSPLMTGHLKNCTDYNFWSKTINLVQSLSDVHLGSGEQKSIFRSIVAHLKILFHTNRKHLALSWGDTKVKKTPPMCQNFLFKLDR